MAGNDQVAQEIAMNSAQKHYNRQKDRQNPASFDFVQRSVASDIAGELLSQGLPGLNKKTRMGLANVALRQIGYDDLLK